MPDLRDLSVRRFSEDEYAALKAKAASEGKSLEQWARETLIRAAQEPTVRQRYTLAANTGPAYVEIRRTEDSLSDPRPFLRLLDEQQRSAFEQALQFVKRNGPGDREAAYAALARGFENVRESLI
jgi:plasmid stability protein